MHAPATVRGIQSRRNEQVKKLRQALARGERTPEGLLAVDTFHLLEEALSSPSGVRSQRDLLAAHYRHSHLAAD